MLSATELDQKAGQLVDQARSLLNEIKDDTEESRAKELESQHDAIMAEYDAVMAKWHRAKKLEDAEKRADEQKEREVRNKRPEERVDSPAVDDGEEVSYRAAFHKWVKSGGREAELAPEVRAALKPEYRAQVTSTDSAGGFMVPTELLNRLTERMAMWGPMYSSDIFTIIAGTSGNKLTMPTVDDTAGRAPQNTSEGATLTDDGGRDVVFGERQLDAYSYDTEWLRISYELNSDSDFAMEPVIAQLLAKRIGRTVNEALTIGTGSNQPHGIVTASTAGLTAASATAITADELISLEHSVDPAYRGAPNVAFMMHDSTLEAIRKLKDGDGNFLFQRGDIRVGTPNTLLGYNFVINQAMPTIATGNRVALFGDMESYFVRRVGAPLIGSIQDKDFWPGVGIAGYVRVDGELSDVQAIKHLVMN
ncbi:MAG: phage major capsid protein [Pseudomonadota bacterium]